MGRKRQAPRSSSPTADRLLVAQQVASAMQDLLVPHRRRDAYWRLRRLGDAARPAVEEGLFADDPDLRVECTLLIDHLAGNDSFDLMLLLLDDDDPRVRGHAMHALACDRCKTDDVCALPRHELLPEAARLLADDPYAPVRSVALEVLGRWVHEDPAARAAIERAASDDPSAWVRRKAAWYLPGGRKFEQTKKRVRRTA